MVCSAVNVSSTGNQQPKWCKFHVQSNQHLFSLGPYFYFTNPSQRSPTPTTPFCTMTASIGDAIEVYWPDDKQYYSGKVAAYNSNTGNSCIHYDDGEVEEINLAYEQWRFVGRSTPALSLVSLPSVLEPMLHSRSCVPLVTESINSPTFEELSTSTATLKKAGPREVNTRQVARSSKSSSTRKPLKSPSFVARRSQRKTVSQPVDSENNTTTRSGRISKKRCRTVKKVTSPKLAPPEEVSSGKTHLASQSGTPPISNAAALHIEVCVDYWLRNEIRKDLAMFSLYQCCNHTIGMLTSAIVDPEFHRKLMRKRSSTPRWITTDEQVEELGRRHLVSKAEWEQEKSIIIGISRLVREAATSQYEYEIDKVNEKPTIEALRLVLYAKSRAKYW